MATGYMAAMSNDAGNIGSQIRYYYSTSYNAATNTSTITLTPQLYCGTNLGSDIRMFDPGSGTGASTPGIRVDQSTLWSFSGGYGGSKHLSCSSSNWASMYANTGTKFSFTKQHDNNGNVSWVAGICGAVSGWQTDLSRYDWPTGRSQTVHEDRQLNVSYDANGGSGAPSATYFYGTTEGITLSDTAPTRTGYTFLGWSASSTATTATYSAGQYIGTRTSSLPLYAVWQINSYNVSLTAGNYISAVSGGGSKQYTSSVTATASLGSAAGYSYAFDGWYDENDTLVSSANPYTFTMPAENVSLTAKATRTANSYTVHFDANGGSGTMSDESFVYDQSKALTANAFSRAGYSFLGWSKNQNATSPTYTDEQVVTNLATSGTVTLYAVWSLRSFLLYFSTSHGHISVTRESSPIGGGATGALYSGGTVYTGDEIIITFSADVGYTLTTHTVNAVTFTSGSTYVVSGNTSILQMATANTYYVRFNPNRPTGSGSGSMSNQSFTYDVSQALSQNTFTRYFTATFNANGGTSAVGTSNVYCTFRGWGKSTTDQVVYTDKQSVVNLTSQPNGIVDLYAKWQYGMVVLPTATRPGYTFKGWYSAASGGNKVGNAGNSFQLSQNAVYYAQWEPITYSLSVVTSDNGCTVNVLRTASPYGGGSSGLLNNGATLYYGDALTISYSINQGYQKKTATVNGTAFGTDSGGTTLIASVQASVSVVVQVEIGALVYVANEAYQAFIEDGVVFEQYEAFIDNGASWDAY